MSKRKSKWQVAWVRWDPPRVQRYVDEGWEPFAAVAGDPPYSGPTVCFRKRRK